MKRNTDRLLELTNELLDYRQTEAGGFTLSFKEENISRLMQETYFSFKPLADKKKLGYQLHLAKEPLVAYADNEALTKIISNLLSNAIKYADKKILITLQANATAKTFRIVVQNDGDIVPEEAREKIFEPFFRLKKTEKQKGTGIGLALAKSLAELHGGTLVFEEKESLNVFVLTLPTNQEKQQTAEKSITPSKAGIQANEEIS